jgi:hypothetical protein|tara:strand:- start:332 stop:1309 length:978 start_codon:yes stop_codon:yes gene_type:complete
MAQADGEVANQSGAAVRSDLNQQLAAIFTNHSGPTEPPVPAARRIHQWWYDESNNILKIRNEADNGWINVIDFNAGAEGALHVPVGAAATTSIRPAADANSGFFFRQGDNAGTDGYGFGYAMNGIEYLTVEANTAAGSDDPSLCWLSRDANINETSASSAGVKMTQAGRLIVCKDQGFVLGINRMNSTGDAVLFNNNPSGGSSATVGRISVTTSSTSYVTSSDHRLKENVVELTGAKARLQQLAVKRFNFIVDPDTTVDGFLAHEAQAVVPEAVTGTHNEVDADGNPVHQGIDQAKLVPLLTAALQEAFAEIAALTARVETLEAG